MAQQSKLWHLKHFNIFEGMDDAALERVNQMSSMAALRRSAEILKTAAEEAGY